MVWCVVWYGVVQYGMVWRWHGNQGGARLKSTQAGGAPLAWHGFPHLVKCNKMAEKAVKKMGWNLGNSLIKKICLNLKTRKFLRQKQSAPVSMNQTRGFFKTSFGEVQ